MPPKTEMPSGEAKHRFNSSWLLKLVKLSRNANRQEQQCLHRDAG